MSDETQVIVAEAIDGGWECLGCSLHATHFATRVDLYNHLIDHMSAQQRVPDELLRRLAREISEEREATRPKWTEEEARDLLAKLSLYYDEPVKPISEYCRAFRVWQEAIEDASLRETNPGLKESFEAMAGNLRATSLYVSKSNLLSRLLYCGEELRTEPCPVHKGHWAGCVWGEHRCPHCMSGDNVTGWVAPKKL